MGTLVPRYSNWGSNEEDGRAAVVEAWWWWIWMSERLKGTVGMAAGRYRVCVAAEGDEKVLVDDEAPCNPMLRRRRKPSDAGTGSAMAPSWRSRERRDGERGRRDSSESER